MPATPHSPEHHRETAAMYARMRDQAGRNGDPLAVAILDAQRVKHEALAKAAERRCAGSG